MPSFRLDSQIALVTGASEPLGAAIAVALAEAGADIAVHAPTLCPEDTCERVRRLGRRAVPITGDLADASEPARLIADALGAFGRLDVLVGLVPVPPIVDDPSDEAAWDRLIWVRLSSTFRLCRAFGGYLLDSGRPGRIINVAAPRDACEGPGQAASNGGVRHLTRALAREWAPHRIAVNAIAPGYVRTLESGAPVEAQAPGGSARPIPAHGWGDPEHVAGAAVFLASPAAAHVNGHVLVVDGGWSG